MTSINHLTVKATRRAMLERMSPKDRDAYLRKTGKGPERPCKPR
jgi:hypothetical protein